MRRRDFVKAMMAASVSCPRNVGTAGGGSCYPRRFSSAFYSAASAAACRAGAGAVDARPDGSEAAADDRAGSGCGGADECAFLHRQQMATLRRLSEILLPPLKGYPGALDAGTPEFLDFLIGVSPADRQQMYQSGLDRLDAEARQAIRHTVCRSGDAQADQLLRPWLRTWMTDHPPTEPYARLHQSRAQRYPHRDDQLAGLERSRGHAAEHRDTGRWVCIGFPVDPDIRRENSAPIGGQPSTRSPTTPAIRDLRRDRSTAETEKIYGRRNCRCTDHWSGHSGGMAAKILTEKGISCLMLNAGPIADVHKDTEVKPAYALPYRGFKQPGQLPHVFQSNEFNANTWVDEKEVPYTYDPQHPYNWVRVRLFGGRSLFWSRQSFRLSDYEFKGKSHDGYGDDWPISLADLAPYYSRVEGDFPRARTRGRAAAVSRRQFRAGQFAMVADACSASSRPASKWAFRSASRAARWA